MRFHRTRFWYQGVADVSFSYYDGYLIDFPTGASQLDATAVTVRSPDGIGVDIQQKTVPERNVTINGYVFGFPSEDYRRALERAFAPNSTGRLWAETEDLSLFFLDCFSTGTPVIEGIRNKPRFQVALMAEYPYWQRDVFQEFRLELTGQAGEYPREIISDVPALFELNVTASAGCQGAAIRIDGEELRYNAYLSAGQTLSVQVDKAGRASAMLGGQSVVGNLAGGLKKLPPGNHVIRLEAAGNTGTVTAAIKYREARAGV